MKAIEYKLTNYINDIVAMFFEIFNVWVNY